MVNHNTIELKRSRKNES